MRTDPCAAGGPRAAGATGSVSAAVMPGAAATTSGSNTGVAERGSTAVASRSGHGGIELSTRCPWSVLMTNSLPTDVVNGWFG